MIGEKVNECLKSRCKIEIQRFAVGDCMNSKIL